MNILLKTMINRHHVICFDIFDTLIERTVDKPSDIFCLVGAQILGREYKDEFCEARVLAEKRAREKTKSGEVTLDEVYMCLPEQYKKSDEYLKTAEIEAELNHCVIKKNMVGTYNYCVTSNKIVFLVSDMYLPKPVVSQIVQNCGITGFKEIYVSNVYGCNKISGKLFEIVASENSLPKAEILHIGDSVKADFIGARKAGIQSYLIRRKNRFRRLF